MAGVRVSQLPSNVTEKHLKVYFSNPRNGGGQVTKILHPLTNNGAIIAFDEETVVNDLVSRTHHMMHTEIVVERLAKQIFRQVVVEVEAPVSNFMLMNPQLVDELQFIGELDITLREDKKIYFLTGSWYQLEWALYYLDTMLDTFGFETETAQVKCQTSAATKVTGSIERESEMTNSSRNKPISGEWSPAARSSEIKRPNIPAVKRTDDTLRTRRPPPEMNFIPKHSVPKEQPPASIMKRKKNKNMSPGSTSGSNNREDDETLKMNLNVPESQAESEKATKQIQNSFNSDTSDDEFPLHVKLPGLFKAAGYGGYNSDSENETPYGNDPQVNFAPDTDFTENKGRPRRLPRDYMFELPVPEKTRGMDVAQAVFGDVPLSFTFDLKNGAKVHVSMDDITKQTTNAILNPASAGILTNLSAVSRAILTSGGREIQLECRQYMEELGELSVGQVIHTSAGGSLSGKVGFVLHVYGPQWREHEADRCTHMLICSYLNSFMYADNKLWLQSIALPLINAGVYGFPVDVSIQAFYDALLLFQTGTGSSVHLKEIRLVCFDQDTAMAAIMITRSLLDCETSQASGAALNRYMTRKQDFNFSADHFDPSVTTDKGNDEKETNADANETDVKGDGDNANVIGEELGDDSDDDDDDEEDDDSNNDNDDDNDGDDDDDDGDDEPDECKDRKDDIKIDNTNVVEQDYKECKELDIEDKPDNRQEFEHSQAEGKPTEWEHFENDNDKDDVDTLTGNVQTTSDKMALGSTGVENRSLSLDLGARAKTTSLYESREVPKMNFTRTLNTSDSLGTRKTSSSSATQCGKINKNRSNEETMINKTGKNVWEVFEKDTDGPKKSPRAIDGNEDIARSEAGAGGDTMTSDTANDTNPEAKKIEAEEQNADVVEPIDVTDDQTDEREKDSVGELQTMEDTVAPAGQECCDKTALLSEEACNQ